jgi:transcription initiation factor IIE alpha subunit
MAHKKDVFSVLVHPLRLQIVNFLIGKEYLSTMQIAEGIKCEMNLVNAHLKTMHLKGLLHRKTRPKNPATIRWDVEYVWALNTEKIKDALKENIPKLQALLDALETYWRR